MSKKRHSMPRRRSERNFTRNAMRVNNKNMINVLPMRGGIRF